jgi:hypothetical protein
MSDEHQTHVEREHVTDTYYFWCEADDCYVGGRNRYHAEAEAVAAASFHEREPG